MSVDVTAIIRKEAKADPRTGNRSFYTSLALFSEDATEYGPPRLFDAFEEVAELLQKHAGVTYENLRDSFRRYEAGQEVQIDMSLENEAAIANLGFSPPSAAA